MKPTTPVTVLTGFLGSGKTTLLGRSLADPSTRDTAVLINEVGEIAIDQDLIQCVREDLVVLASGCVCCSVRNDLVRALCELHVRAERGEIPRFSRVVVETTGLADPTPIVGTLAKHGLLRTVFHLSNLVTAVDATLGSRNLTSHAEAVKQVALADRLLVTKTDLADAHTVEALERRLRGANPLARHARARNGAVEAGGEREEGRTLLAWATDTALAMEPPPALGDAHEHAHAHEHVLTFSETLEEPVDYQAFALWLSMSTQLHGEHLLRVKAILHVVDDPLPVVAQAVQHVVYPVTTLPSWPFSPRASRIVVIARGLDQELLDALRRSLRSVVSA